MNPSTTFAIKRAFWIGALAGWFAAGIPDAGAWEVYNYTERTMVAEVYHGSTRTWVWSIAPGSHEGCHYGNTSCNPGGNPENELTLLVSTPDGIADYVGRITLLAGGHAAIYERDRGVMGAPRDLYCVSFKSDFARFDFDSWDLERNWTNRHVRFLVSADCQYSLADSARDDLDRADAVHDQMRAIKQRGRHVRGILYAGDLTQSTAMDEWDHFKTSVASFERYLFHGLGNHDVAEPTLLQQTACDFFDTHTWIRPRTGCIDPDEIHAHVRDLKRATRKTQKGDPHYSWDWHDVHFVQLNLFPGNEKPSALPDGASLPSNTEYRDHDPMGALSFLIGDLASSVGDSGRPVVLIHHYGFDDFSRGQVPNGDGIYEIWWTERQRMAYWAALQGYNVAGVFTGHQHLSGGNTNWVIHWKPASAGSGTPIPTFVSGGALYNVFLEVEIDSSDRMTVIRRNAGGNVPVTNIVCLPRTIRYANAASSGVQDGTALYPFQRVHDAVNTLGTISSECGAPPEVQLRTGYYPQPIRITRPARLTARGGMARVGP